MEPNPQLLPPGSGITLPKRRRFFASVWKWLGLVFGLMALACGFFAIRAYEQARIRSLTVSDANHVTFIPYELAANLPGSDLSNGNLDIKALPYDPTLPGYAVFAKYSHDWAKDSRGPWVNSNFGAEGFMFGGWQALNLPNDKMLALEAEWRRRAETLPDEEKWECERGLPYAWSGGVIGYPSDSSWRVGLRVSRNGTGWNVEEADFHESELGLLNDCLKVIGEKSVEINVPQGIDWDQYQPTDAERVAATEKPQEPLKGPSP